jgi:GntR family transcriptional regulator
VYHVCGTVCFVIFRVNPASGQPIYLQLMEQVQHAVETGVLQDGDQMPGIRTLAEELVVSHNTIAKAYTELQHMGLLELRHGSGAFISAKRQGKMRTEQLRRAQLKVARLVEELHGEGFTDEEMRRLFEAQILNIDQIAGKQ